MAETAARAEVEVAGPERLIYVSDAVIAIAITLLALELPAPGEGVRGDASVLAFFGAHSQEYLAFLISFGAVAMHWLIHQRLFRYAVGLDGRLIRWNLLWLLMIVLMPFTTKLLTTDVDAFPVQFTVYAADQALAGLFLLLAVSDLRRFRLLRADAPAEVITNAREFMTAVTIMFALSVPVAFVTNWALLCWVLLPVVRAAVRLVGRRISASA